MGYNRQMGILGEELAREYLIAHGYKIVMCNYRIKGGEIDIIAAQGAWIVFVEVKTRNNMRYGAAIESVDEKKRARIRRAAQYYTYQFSVENFCRYDVLEVYLTQPATIQQYQNAFE